MAKKLKAETMNDKYIDKLRDEHVKAVKFEADANTLYEEASKKFLAAQNVLANSMNELAVIESTLDKLGATL